MPVAGNSYRVNLDETHLRWGEFRTQPASRKIIRNEVYFQIPLNVAKSFHIYNSNYNSNGGDVLGINIFNCTSADGFFEGVLKSSGCSKKGDTYAKNLHGKGDLKALAPWIHYCNAQVGDQVEITWTSPTDIVLRFINLH